jgi:hypothetical protein
VKTLAPFVIDDEGWSHADMVLACRLILRTVEDDASRCETDIPATRPDWPPDVRAAAGVLLGVAAQRGRAESPSYARTGVIEVTHDEVWSAFVTFAPWAYDASVWNAAADHIVSLADEGCSIVVRLTPEQYSAIAAELGQARLVPEVEWRRVSKQRGQGRR